MKSVRTLLLLTAVCLLWIASAAAQDPAPECGALTAQALELSGMNEFVEQLPAIFEEYARDKMEEDAASPEEQEKFLAAMQGVFDPEVVSAGLRTALERECEPAVMQSAVASLDSPLAQKMRKLEAAAGTAEGAQRLEEFAGNLPGNPPEAGRLQLVRRLDEISGASEFQADMTIAMLQGMAEGFGQEKQAAEQLPTVRRDLFPVVRASVLVTMLFSYQEASDQELNDYIALYESEPLQRFTRTVTQAFNAAVKGQAKEAARRLKAGSPAGQSPAPTPD